jgi:hypothetical protein
VELTKIILQIFTKIEKYRNTLSIYKNFTVCSEITIILEFKTKKSIQD